MTGGTIRNLYGSYKDTVPGTWVRGEKDLTGGVLDRYRIMSGGHQRLVCSTLFPRQDYRIYFVVGGTV